MAIISHENKFIFIHIPKTAGTSINKALTKETKVTPQKIGRKFRYLPSLLNPKTQVHPKFITPPIEKHAKAIEIKDELGKGIWNDYFTFSFVRNPWDLMVSSYKWWLQKAAMWSHLQKDICRIKKMQNFKEFLKSPYGSQMINEQSGSIMDWLTDNESRIIVDYIGKFESLEDDFKRICIQLGKEHLALPHINITKRKGYREYYDDETQQWIASRFSKTIKIFQYNF